MYENLTEKQIKILEYIIQENKLRGYPPSVREICKAVGFKSTSSVHSHLGKIEEAGYIRKDPSKPRAIEVLNKALGEDVVGLNQELIPLPVVGEITAGTPILAEENIEEYIPLPASIVVGRDNFLLKVSGESMIEAGIYDGDMVIVDKRSTAKNGEMLAVLVDQEYATIKTYYNEDRYIRLQPENSTMEALIYEKERVQILGKVTGLFRMY